MGTVTDFHRAGHGFSGLRKRYVRRAEFLSRHPAFLESMERFRDTWNEVQTISRLPVYASTGFSFMPHSVINDYIGHEKHKAEIRVNLERLEESGAPEAEQQQARRKYLDLIKSFSGSARGWWVEESEQFVLKWFPAEDFPNPYPNRAHPTEGPDVSFCRTSHPALMFISVAMQTDARLISDLDALFEPMELEPIDLFPYLPRSAECDEDDDICWEVEPEIACDADLQWYLPLYPGLTVEDLRNAAPTIVARVNEIYGSRTASARVIVLRAKGCTHLEIANRLGLSESNVRGILKQGDPVSA